MYRFIRRRDIPYILITITVGILAHSIYEFSGKNPITALIAPVNESVWEHLKILFFPFLLASLTEYYMQRPASAAFFSSHLIGVWTGMLSIIFLFYGYSGIFGRSFVPVDIFLFFIGVITAYYISFKCARKFNKLEPLTVFLLWIFTILLFFIFTCFPPELPLFLPPM